MNRIEFMTGLTIIIIGVSIIVKNVLYTMGLSNVVPFADIATTVAAFISSLITGILLIIDSFKKES